jgi:hypothetical protein
LITSKRILRTGDVENLLFLGHGSRVVLWLQYRPLGFRLNFAFSASSG